MIDETFPPLLSIVNYDPIHDFVALGGLNSTITFENLSNLKLDIVNAELLVDFVVKFDRLHDNDDKFLKFVKWMKKQTNRRYEMLESSFPPLSEPQETQRNRIKAYLAP